VQHPRRWGGGVALCLFTPRAATNSIAPGIWGVTSPMPSLLRQSISAVEDLTSFNLAVPYHYYQTAKF
jgi:hypothetical protein